MKKRIAWSLLLVAALMLMAAPVALAYGSVTGQVNDVNGAPWTHGGTVTCVAAAGATIGTGSINPDGSWSVTLSQHRAVICAIDPAAASGGNPTAVTCNVPFSGSVTSYDCGVENLAAGPNAVSLSSFTGQSLGPAWLLAPLGLVAGLLAWKRNR